LLLAISVPISGKYNGQHGLNQARIGYSLAKNQNTLVFLGLWEMELFQNINNEFCFVIQCNLDLLAPLLVNDPFIQHLKQLFHVFDVSAEVLGVLVIQQPRTLGHHRVP
jgi:hypothetical protein